MSVRRLTQDLCQRLTTRLLDHRFGEELKKLKDKEHDLAVTCYNAAFSKLVREKLRGLPDGWLPQINNVSVQVGESSSSYFRLDLPSGEKDSFPVPFSRRHSTLLVISLPDPVARNVLDWGEQCNSLSEQIKKLELKLRTTLRSFTTIPALVKEWPEVEPHIAALFPGTAQLPAIPTAQLNAALNLP